MNTKPRKRKLKTAVTALAVIAIALIFVPAAIPTEVGVLSAAVTGDTESTVSTNCFTFDGLKYELAKDIGENDLVLVRDGNEYRELGDSELIGYGAEIKIMKAESSKAIIGGEEQDINLYQGTVAETLALNDIEYDDDDRISPALEDEVTDGAEITLDRVEIKVKEKTKTVKFKEEVLLDSSLRSGAVDMTEGKDGKAVYTYTTTYVNGKKESTKKKRKEWIEKPVDQVLRLGTSETGESGPVTYSWTFTGNTTAYYAGKNATGALGTRCYYGTCAVDPSFVPYGTKLFVEGYGTAIANDCGGAVRNNVVDLYMHSTKECFSWGRRYVTVYVLD